MTKQEHLLTCLNEECSEVIKEVSKALRFGLDDINPITNTKNGVAIAKELNDLLAIIEMLSKDEEILDDVIIQNVEYKEKKKLKVDHYMKYAKQKGAIV